MSRFVLLSPNTEFDHKLRAAVANRLRRSVQTLALDILPAGTQALFALLNQKQPEVLIIGPDVPPDEALRFAKGLRRPASGLSIVQEDADPAVLLHAIRAGIRDIMSPSADASEIHVLLERVCQSFGTRNQTFDSPHPENAGKGLVVGVFSPKGGVGKTTLATNIAIGLGQIAPL